METTPFHLAIPVSNLATMRAYYRDVLGCNEGRSSDNWVDFNFFGHQLVLHQKEGFINTSHSNPVDGKDVPVPHFGVVLKPDDWNNLANRLKELNTQFIIEPYTRFENEAGEQATLFFSDPEGNALEFKSFKNIDQLFAR